MSIIVDTSVWSLALRRGNPSSNGQVQKLAAAIKQGQCIELPGVILQEVLQGIKNASDFEKVKAHLEAFSLLELNREDYVAAAQLMNHCRSNGIQASTIDFQIAASCIRHDCQLLTSDNDFQHIARFSSLQLL
jgi:predicted nucleic acid-binding protein